MMCSCFVCVYVCVPCFRVRFWRMARTFTGLKLQGDIGKFGKVELSDVDDFAEMPDGKVRGLSGLRGG